MALKSMEDLFVHEIRDLYSAENQLIKALPKMAKAANTPALQHAIQMHLQQTETHAERLQQIFDQIKTSSRGPKCKAMEGLIAEGDELLKEDAEPEVADAGLIGSAQRVEHYEIAAYGTARTFAQYLGFVQAVTLLEKTLQEEKDADAKLNEIALNQVNSRATNESGQSGNQANRMR